MKKLATFTLISLISGAAFSATSIAPSASPTGQDIANADCAMVNANNTFNFKPSANVGVAWTCNTTAAAVQTGSIKGKYVYGGGTSGGAVQQCGTAAVKTDTGYSAAPASADGTGCP